MPRKKKKQPKTPPKSTKLLGRQAEFVRHYVAGEDGVRGNQTKSAEAAGYSKKASAVQGHALLRNPKVAAAIEARRQKIEERADVTAEQIVRELARIALGDPRRVAKWGPDGVSLLDSSTLSDDDAAMIASVSETPAGVGFKLHNKQAALDALAKYRGITPDRQEVVQITQEMLDAMSDGQLERLANGESLLTVMASGRKRDAS